MAGDKIDVSFEINTDSEKLLEQIVENTICQTNQKLSDVFLIMSRKKIQSGMKCLLRFVVIDADKNLWIN